MKTTELVRRWLYPWQHDSLIYEVTARCNQDCGHCCNLWRASDAEPPADELETEQALALLREVIADCRCRHLQFTGGEPLLRGDLEVLVKAAADLGVRVSISTNGSLLTEERISRLLAVGAEQFELPLYAAQGWLHDRMTGTPGAFTKVTQAASELRVQGGRVVAGFVATHENADEWGPVIELGMSMGIRAFLFYRWSPTGAGKEHPDELMPTVDQVERALSVANTYAERYELVIGVPIPMPPCLIDASRYPKLAFRTCSVGTPRARYTIDPAGNLRPCVHAPLVLGNLLQEKLPRLVQSAAMAAFKAARPRFCQRCGAVNECRGGCKAAAMACHGDMCACDPFVELNRERVKMPPLVEVQLHR